MDSLTANNGCHSVLPFSISMDLCDRREVGRGQLAGVEGGDRERRASVIKRR